jgi:hypothetical protein
MRYRHREIEQPFTACEACTIGYFAKISSARLNALSAAVCSAMPSFMISTQPALQTCSAALAAPCRPVLPQPDEIAAPELAKYLRQGRRSGTWPANLRVQDFPRQRDKDSPLMVPLFFAQFAAGASPWRNPYAMAGVTPLSQLTTAG